MDRAGVPKDQRGARTKPEIALDLLDRVRAEGLPGRAVVADTGARAADYTLTPPMTTASITPRALTVTGVVAANKVYDGTTTAALDTRGAP